MEFDIADLIRQRSDRMLTRQSAVDPSNSRAALLQTGPHLVPLFLPASSKLSGDTGKLWAAID